MVKIFGRRLWGDGAGEASSIKPKVSESSKGKDINEYTFTARKSHPNNMGNYEEWSKDPEAAEALTVLSKMVAGPGFHTKDKAGKESQKVDNYCEAVNLDEKLVIIARQLLAKGFCPVELIEQDDVHILPSETFYIYRDRKGNVLKYTQEENRQVITTWNKNELDDVVLFYNQETPIRPYGTSILDSIGSLLDMRKELNADMKKGVHRWANPIPIMETSKSKTNSTALTKAIEDRDVDDWLLVYDVAEKELTWNALSVEPSARFVPYVELIYYQICEGLHAPLLLYLKNATEASAKVMMESVDRFIDGLQRHIKRRVERNMFRRVVGSGEVPRLIWGKPKTGLEKATFTELSMLVNSPSIAYNQKEWLLKQYGIELPKPDWKSGPPPELMQPQTPFQSQPKPAKKENLDEVIRRINDLNMQLNIIYENWSGGKLKISEALHLAEDAITVNMQRAYPVGWEPHKEKAFKQFVRERLMIDKNPP